MLSNYFEKANTKSGFTIVELLIVVVVIAILAAITIVSYNGITERATESLLKANLNTGAKKISLISIDTGQYPIATTLPEGVPETKDATTTYTSTDGTTFCLAVVSTKNANHAYSINQTGTITNDADCGGTGGNPAVVATDAACFTYQTDPEISSQVQITDYNPSLPGCGTDVVIPSTLGGKTVTTIGIGASGYGFYGKGLTSVQLPETAVSIGLYAFFNNKLTTVTLPASLETLGAYSFTNNTATSNANITCRVPAGNSFYPGSNNGCGTIITY